MRLRILATLLVAAPVLAQAPATPSDPLAPLRFLEGTWRGEGGGAPGEGTGGFSFRLDLDGKVMVRRNHSDYPAQGQRLASHHEDLVVVYAAAGGLRALYVDNEGHAIHYSVAAASEGDGVVFQSDEGPGPRFRLTYRRTTPDTVGIRFEIAPPGKPFVTYLDGTARRTPQSSHTPGTLPSLSVPNMGVTCGPAATPGER